MYALFHNSHKLKTLSEPDKYLESNYKMRLSLVALTTSLAILAAAAPVNKSDETAEDLGVGVGLELASVMEMQRILE